MRRALIASLVLLSGCEPPWSPSTLIEGLRVIGIRAEPAEIRPGQAARLEALLLDPSRPGAKSTVLWVGCDPDPFAAGRGACSDLDALSSASFVDASMLPAGVRVIGFNNQAAYAAPANLFDVLPKEDPRRQTGTVGTLIAIAIAEEVPINATTAELAPLLARVQSKEVSSQLTIFRVRVSESPVVNANPVLDELLVDKAVVPRGAAVQLWPARDHGLDFTAHDTEEYDAPTPNGDVEHKTERIVTAWYSTTGRFSVDRTAMGAEVKAVLTAPGAVPEDPLPEDHRGTLWMVARDSRGGQSWRSHPIWICDPTLQPPLVASAVQMGRALTLRGRQLESVLDVSVDGDIVPGAFDRATGRWEGMLPVLAAGAHGLLVRGRECGATQAGWVLGAGP